MADNALTPGDGMTLDPVILAAINKAGGTGSIGVSKTHVTSEQLLTLHTTAIELVPAPAADKLIVPISYAFIGHLGSQETDATGRFMFAYGGDPNDGEVTALLSANDLGLTIGATADPGVAISPAAFLVSGAIGVGLNLALIGTVAFTTGNGSVDVIVVYAVA